MRNPIVSKVAGDFDENDDAVLLSDEALQLINEAYKDIPSDEVWDYHVHILGKNTEKTGCWINPSVLSWAHPLDHTQYAFIVNAAGIENMESADDEYLQRLLLLTRTFPKPGKFCLLAIDKSYTIDGVVTEEDTKFYIPNEYVVNLSKKYSDIFIPCISVHPYRKDALEELQKWGDMGVKMVKWMPNVMGMNASEPCCIPFYKMMISYGMVLLTHTGKEDIMPVHRYRYLNNPLLFRPALDLGLKIIMAHCGTLGTNPDLDSKENTTGKNMDFFLRLMSEKKYEGLLFGDISALTETHRLKSLITILKKTDIHHRLINGSDYPLPAVNALMSTKLMAKLGLIKNHQIDPLNEIYRKNPLLFDFVLKRTLRHPEHEGIRFPASMFAYNEELYLHSINS